MNKPRIFLGSSGKQTKLLQGITRGLEAVAEVEPWTTTFNPGRSTLDRLVELSQEVDFAAFVFAQDADSARPGSFSPSSSGRRVEPNPVDRSQRRVSSLFQNQPSKRSCKPKGGSPALERAMSGSKSLSSMSVAASALRAIIMISELR